MKKKYRILKKQLKKVVKEAVFSATESDGAEICGLLIDNGYFIELIIVQNRKKQGGGFEFYPDEIRFIEEAMEKMNHEIIGTFHSHPTYIAEPSESDIKNAVDDSIMMVIDVLDKKVGLWHIKNKRKNKLTFNLI